MRKIATGDSRLATTLLRLDGQALFLPGFPSSNQRSCLRPAGGPQLSRHPGACGFIHSGTVQHDGSMMIEAQLARLAHRVIWRKTNGPLRTLVIGSVGTLCPYVRNDDLLA